jgi:hypothetical protein
MTVDETRLVDGTDSKVAGDAEAIDAARADAVAAEATHVEADSEVDDDLDDLDDMDFMLDEIENRIAPLA